MMFQRTKNEKQKANQYRFLAFFCCSLFLVLSSCVSVQAAAISPLQYTIVVDPSTSQDVAFRVTNDTDKERIYRMSVDGFSIDSKSGAAVFGAMSRALSWVTFPTTTFTLPPNTTQEIFATITVPDSETAQTYYLAVFAQEVASDTENTGIGARVGTLVFLTVGGTIIEDLDIDYIVPQTRLSTGDPSVIMQLSNNGNITLPYVGVLTLTRLDGTVVDQTRIGSTTIYAQTKQEHVYSWSSLKSVGPLRASLAITYGVSQQMVIDTTIFWYVPLYILVIVGVLIGGSVVFFVLMRRRHMSVF